MKTLSNMYKAASCLRQYSELHYYQKSFDVLRQGFVTTHYYSSLTSNVATTFVGIDMMFVLCGIVFEY